MYARLVECSRLRLFPQPPVSPYSPFCTPPPACSMLLSLSNGPVTVHCIQLLSKDDRHLTPPLSTVLNFTHRYLLNTCYVPRSSQYRNKPLRLGLMGRPPPPKSFPSFYLLMLTCRVSSSPPPVCASCYTRPDCESAENSNLSLLYGYTRRAMFS